MMKTSAQKDHTASLQYHKIDKIRKSMTKTYRPVTQTVTNKDKTGLLDRPAVFQGIAKLDRRRQSIKNRIFFLDIM